MRNFIVKSLFIGDEWFELADLLGANYVRLFASGTKVTIGCEFGLVSVNMDTANITLQLWDFSYEERFRFLREAYYRGGKVVIIAFDLRSQESFQPRIGDLINEIYASTDPIPIIILGCNADLENEHQVSREDIDELLNQNSLYQYKELNSNMEGFNTILGAAALLAIQRPGFEGEFGEPIVEEVTQIRERIRKNALAKKERLTKFVSILKEMKYHVDDKYQVEILTYRGLFTVNVKANSVLFEPNYCDNCLRGNCQIKVEKKGKPLCIISDGRGWSNTELDQTHLLVLSKIIAIAEDNLPEHVLNQIADVCLGPISDEADITQELYQQISLQITPMEANTLLRNSKIQFFEGRLPHYVYIVLKEKYERIMTIH